MLPLTQSLKGRLVFASLLLLPIACGVLGWSLDRAYESSLLESQKRQMITQAYALMAAAELEEDKLWLPERVTDDRLNQLSSGMYAQVYSEGQRQAVWQSLSSVGISSYDAHQSGTLLTGESQFGEMDNAGEWFFFLNYKVDWEDEQGKPQPFVFSVLESTELHDIQLVSYRQTLWLWLTVIAALLIGLQILILLWGLRPIDKVVDDLNAVKSGESNSLEGLYPNELKGLTSSINQLIQHEASQRARYRDTLADLAHSIKNPVSIINGALKALRLSFKTNGLDDIEEQSQRINQIISYQLTRAVGQSAAPFNQAISIEPLVEKIRSAMLKVYADKTVAIDLNIAPNSVFRGDQGDLMEMLGNIIDNACKYSKQKIKITAEQTDELLLISVEDDGKGITAEQQSVLLKRGARADTTLPGQGIGLAVVEDIVRSYNGELDLGQSSMGGLKVEIKFHSLALTNSDMR